MDLVDLRVHYMHIRDILVLTCFILLMFYNSKKLRAIISIFIFIYIYFFESCKEEKSESASDLTLKSFPVVVLPSPSNHLQLLHLQIIASALSSAALGL